MDISLKESLQTLTVRLLKCIERRSIKHFVAIYTMLNKTVSRHQVRPKDFFVSLYVSLRIRFAVKAFIVPSLFEDTESGLDNSLTCTKLLQELHQASAFRRFGRGSVNVCHQFSFAFDPQTS